MNLHQRSPELLPPAAADHATVVGLTKILEEQKSDITNRSARSIYPKKKSVLTNEAAPGKTLKDTLKKSPLLVKLVRQFKRTILNREIENCLIDLRDLFLSYQTSALQRSYPNPLNKFGVKCFSQTDEDGITLEILKRTNSLDNGTFAEFGVGDGTENNTLILKALGWKGFWVGGEELAFKTEQRNQAFAYIKAWITLDNIVELAEQGKKALNANTVDVISLDLDGNDFYFVDKLLSKGFTPKLFIVEYNAKFPPPIKWKINYDPTHTWNFDDYFGASLASFVELFEQHGFRLLCCNSHTGSNAFFIRQDFISAFGDVPQDIKDIYVPPRYYLYKTYGHRPSLKTISKLFI